LIVPCFLLVASQIDESRLSPQGCRHLQRFERVHATPGPRNTGTDQISWIESPNSERRPGIKAVNRYLSATRTRWPKNVSTLSRLSEPSTIRLMYSGRLFRPFRPSWSPLGPKSWPNLVAITTWSRKGGLRFAHEFLVRERTVDLGGVEKGDAALDGRTN